MKIPFDAFQGDPRLGSDFEIGGKNSGDSSRDSFLRHDEKEKASWSEIREGMFEEGKFHSAVFRIEVIRRIQIYDGKGPGACSYAE
jgi:hypothetical protein